MIRRLEPTQLGGARVARGRLLHADERSVETAAGGQSHEPLVPIVVAQLEAHRLFGARDLVVPVQGVDRLLGRQRDEYAEDDDVDFLEEVAPAVDWLRGVDIPTRERTGLQGTLPFRAWRNR